MIAHRGGSRDGQALAGERRLRSIPHPELQGGGLHMAAQSLKIDHILYLLTLDPQRRIIRDGAVLVEQGRISRVGKAAELQDARADRVIDGRAMVVTPGFLNGHMHISYAHPVRGIFPDEQASPLLHVFNLQSAMTEEEEYHATLLGLVELVRNGTVCFLDPGSTKFPDACLQAYEDAGIRVVLGECVTDQPAPWALPRYPAAEAVARTASFLAKWNGRLDGRIRAWAMPFSYETCSAGLLETLKHVVDEQHTGLTLHHNSGAKARQESVARYGHTPTAYLESIGVLGPNVLLALGLGAELGSIEVGKKADLVAFDVLRPEWQALWNPVNNLVYNADGRSVHTVVIDGRVVVDAYRQTFVDEPRLFAKVQEIGERLQARTGITFPRSKWPMS